MNISDSLKADINATIGEKRLREVFADGKPHRFTHLIVFCLDGKSIDREIINQVVVEKEVSTFEEFELALHACSNALSSLKYAQALPLRAGMMAAKLFLYTVMTKPETRVAREYMDEAARTVGRCYACEEVGLLEEGLSIPSHLRAQLEGFIAKYEPLLKDWDMEEVD